MLVVRNACFGGFGLSDYAKLWLKTKGYERDVWNIPRHHPLLIDCVQTLGGEANGRCASLVIEEVESKYSIDDNDGYETVVTPEKLQKQIEETPWVTA